jgi:hypothetical protein
LDEGTLILANHIRQNIIYPVCNSLSDNFEGYIAMGYSVKFTRVPRVVAFRDEAYMSMVKL